MEKKIFEYLTKAEFEKAEELLSGLTKAQIKDILRSIACETDSIVVVGFVLYLYERAQDDFWYDCAVSLLLSPFCYIDGAYSLAFRYAGIVLSHERSEENLVQMLFFHEIPEKLLTDEEARKIAEEIIAVNPENEAAKRVLMKR